MSRARTHAERGTIMLPVVFLVLILGGLSAGALHNGLAERTSITHRETASRALEIAEAGLIRAELEILAQQDLDGDGLGTIDGRVDGGEYEVTAVQDETLPNRWELRARGTCRLSRRIVAVGLRRREAGYWQEGLFARTEFSLNGTIQTDSYDSRLGPYASQAVNEDEHGVYARTRGHVGSNSSIRITGTSAVVRGDAIPGPGSETTFAGQPSVGDTLPRTTELVFPPPPQEAFEAAVAEPDNWNMMIRLDDDDDGEEDDLTSSVNWRKLGYHAEKYAFRAKGHTHIVLPGGTYFFTDLDLSGMATLEIQGPCKIYVTGTLDLTGGGLMNATGEPAQCQIFAHPYALPPGYNPSGGELRLEGGSQVAAAIYAPHRDATIGGNGDLFGSLVAREIKVHGDAYLHFDEALLDVTGDTYPFIERLYWRELSPPPR